VVAALAIVAGTLALAIPMPAHLCRYDGDSGSCDPGNPLKYTIAFLGIAIALGLLYWGLPRKRPSHWETGYAGRSDRS
jgi:hypothetical protein